MKDRIKLIMEKENLTPAKFADRLQINRAIISHILNGRNNPSLDVVTRILGEMNYINSEWLINGTGDMYKEGYKGNFASVEPDLFHQDTPDMGRTAEPIEKSKEIGFKQLNNNSQISEKDVIMSYKNNDRKITQIIIYYDDNTFEVFGPHMK